MLHKAISSLDLPQGRLVDLACGIGSLRNSKYLVKYALTLQDVEDAQRLRHLAFRAKRGVNLDPQALDRDEFDDRCIHVLIRNISSGELVCCFRLMVLSGGMELNNTYSAKYYGLSNLRSFDRPMVEMGRFCIRPGIADPAIMRLAWGAMAKFVDENGVEMLFGCSSFEGIDVESHLDAFALLRERHLAPKRWLPKVKAPRVFRFGSLLRNRKANRRAAMLKMPPLLKSYLGMGGWVSDHAVVDRDLSTLHVFTGLEISSIPRRRARLLRALAL